MRNPWTLIAIAAVVMLAMLYLQGEPEPVDETVPGDEMNTRSSAGVGDSNFEPQAEDSASQRQQPVKSAPVRREGVHGWVRNRDGDPLVDVTVRVNTVSRNDGGFSAHQARSDVTGQFVFTDLDRASKYQMRIEPSAEYAGYFLDFFTVDSLSQPHEIVLERLNLANIEGTVVDSDYVPIADFTLTVDSLDTEFPTRKITSDASGFFRIDGFPVGELRIYTAAPDYFRIRGLEVSADEYRNLTLVIDQGNYRLGGIVRNEHGTPHPHVRVTLKSVIATSDYHSYAYRTRLTDEAGRFEFDSLGGMRHTLGVYATGYKSIIKNHEFQSFEDELEFDLRR